MKAKKLQDKKCDAEIAMIKILEEFNKLCVKNHFQLEDITLVTHNTDENRTFDIDIKIV